METALPRVIRQLEPHRPHIKNLILLVRLRLLQGRDSRPRPRHVALLLPGFPAALERVHPAQAQVVPVPRGGALRVGPQR
ncbi:unnamed protein product, partial [Clonostachys rosea f. rosea IK726]